MNSKMKTAYTCGLNKEFVLKFPKGYWKRQKTLEEGLRVEHLKHRKRKVRDVQKTKSDTY